MPVSASPKPKRGKVGWQIYQDEVARLFADLGYSVAVEASLQGARARHKIDVVVRLAVAGVSVLWIVECKLWKSRVRKQEVMTLAQVAQDIGADRAFLLSERGFQAGAVAASRSTNIQLTDLGELAHAAKHEIVQSQLRSRFREKSSLETAMYQHLFDKHGSPATFVVDDPNELVDLLADCFEIGLAIDKAIANKFPVQLDGEWYTDSEQLVDRLAPYMATLVAKKNSFQARTISNRLDMLSQGEAMILEVRRLLELSTTAFAISFSDAKFEPARRACLDSMRKVGDYAEQIQNRFHGPLGEALTLLRRCLIDGLYLALADVRVDNDKWIAMVAEVKRLADRASAAINAERQAIYVDE